MTFRFLVDRDASGRIHVTEIASRGNHTMSTECPRCDGNGTLDGIHDCRHCYGTGYEDRRARSTCERCHKLTLDLNMRISPDEDGQRSVCVDCCDTLDGLYFSFDRKVTTP